MLAFDLFFQCGPQFPLAENHEARVRNGTNHNGCGVHEMLLTLLCHERADVTDDGSMCRQEECGVNIGGRKMDDALDVDALVNDGGLLPWNAVCDESFSYG